MLEKERNKYIQNLQKIQQDISNTNEEKEQSDVKGLESKKSDLEAELAALIEEEKKLDINAKEMEEEEK